MRLRCSAAAASMSICTMSGQPSLLKSAMSTPMPAMLVCFSEAAALSGRTGGPTRDVLRRVVQQEEVDVAIAVVIEAGSVPGGTAVGHPVFAHAFRECAIAVVDEQQIRAIHSLGSGAGAGDGGVDV